MLLDRALADLTFAERLNFLLTNRIPRRAATRFMGWFSKIENPLVRSNSIGAWKLFVDDLRLHDLDRAINHLFDRPPPSPVNLDSSMSYPVLLNTFCH